MSSTLSGTATLQNEASKPTSRISARQIILGILAVAALAAGITYGIKRWQFASVHEDTDDAQLEGHISPVLPRVSGYVTRVFVTDNQRVEVGQPILEIDARELDLKVAEVSAALDSAKADFATARASVESSRGAAATAAADVRTAIVIERKAASDLVRDRNLEKTGAITTSQLQDTQAAADTASARLAAARSQERTEQALVAVASARAASAATVSKEKAADLDYAKLQRSYATVTAPIAGFVSRKNVEPGQYVETGQTLLSIAADTDVWVVANFKETQMTDMHIGQPVEFTVDSYPGVAFHGKVDSISGATGARFALLPPDNATGNFVKVTQRVPVKIVLTDAPDPAHPLRPGMSVDAVVRVRN